MATTLRNFTPHECNLMEGDEVVLTIPSEGMARCDEQRDEEHPTILVVVDSTGENEISISVLPKSYGPVTGLPTSEPGVLFIVSQLVAERLPEREDLIVPDNMVRGERGVILGCRSFSRPAQ